MIHEPLELIACWCPFTPWFGERVLKFLIKLLWSDHRFGFDRVRGNIFGDIGRLALSL